MPHKYEAALQLTLKPSRRLVKWVVFVHTFALATAMANALILIMKISFCALIGISCWLTIKRINAEHYTIKYTEALGWELLEKGSFASIDILKSTVITTQALFLHFKYGAQGRSWRSRYKNTLLVLNDALADEDFRYLIVKLKTTAIK